MSEPLLAKSWNGRQTPVPTLSWHTMCVMDAAERLLKHRAAWALRATGLSEEHRPLLERIVRFAAWAHDAGKCAQQFQQMLRGKGVQPFRHEVASWYLLVGPLAGFLAAHLPDGSERWMVAACLAGHHRKFEAGGNTAIRDLNGSSELLLGHPDFQEWMRLVPGGPLVDMPRLSAQAVSSSTLRNLIADCAMAREDGDPPLDPPRFRLLAVAKSFLLAADMAGSALPREEQELDWIDAALETRATQEERLTLLRKKLNGSPLRDFQEAAADSQAPWTFIKAGCGTGKTAAACAWGARQHAGRQLWLTYPTTGTATEGYRDSVVEAELEGALLHSRAELDLELLAVPDDPADEAQVREQALRGWAADTVVATVDTLLGIVHNQRAGHYAYPGVCRGALVFDELHAYDDRLFGCLLRFLEAHPGLPCLFMTASLPAGRFQALDDLCRKLHGRSLPVIPGPEGLESLPRYRRMLGDPLRVAGEYLAAGRKVLWVSNTVKRAMETADAAEGCGWNPLRYHSRYRYMDRLERHAEVIQGFSAEGPALACTTQVAEMSLDLSADLLVTDLAPIPALIQRLGRLNRRAKAGSPVCPFIVLEPERDLPYAKSEMEDARSWLDRLGSGPLSQGDLTASWEQKAEVPPRGRSQWLDEPLWTEPDSIRESSPGVSVLLEEDCPRVVKREVPACACLIPMPPTDRKRLSSMARGCFFVAGPDLIQYDPRRGAEWR